MLYSFSEPRLVICSAGQRNFLMSSVSPDGLAEFRKNLHSLLHSNDNIHGGARNRAKNINTHASQASPRAKRQPVENKVIPKKELQFNDEPKLDQKKWKRERRELQNIIDVKNNKILTLSKANLERAETIKVLNEKVVRLERINSQKDIQIDQLEKIILGLQNLSRANEDVMITRKDQIKIHEHHEDDDEEENIEEGADEVDLGPDYYDEDDPHESSMSLMNTDTIDLDKEINLNTQQLMDLDLRHLSIKKPSGPAIYNSNTTAPYNNDSDSDLENYLFSV